MSTPLSASEREWVLKRFNDTAAAYPSEQSLHELFEEQAERTPDAIAVLYEAQQLSYRELNVRANRLAHFLRRCGITEEQYVPLVLPRCLDLVIAQLALLKAGCAYVPIDPQWPPQRQALLIRDCAARFVIGSAPIAAELHDVRWFGLDEIRGRLEDCADHNVKIYRSGESAAYVMYTSGSTGQPKGVIVPHRAISRLVIANGYAQIDAADCIAYSSNPAFDASTFEVWGALLNGARLLVVPQTHVLDSKKFSQVLRQHRVTVLWLTAGLFSQYAEALSSVFVDLNYLLVGGDILDPKKVANVLRYSAPRRLLNGYGPTECTTFSSTYHIQSAAEAAQGIPIGRPVSNTKIYILDDELQPVPIGVSGEIHIGGAGVALGYLNQPLLTKQRFLSDPFSAHPHARLYKTGDLGRWRADGNIEFLGRNDQQVKIRGFRIELGEIEARLADHSSVDEAVVLARDDDTGGKHLVAYVTASRTEAISIETLRTHLGAVLPDYMVPAAYVVLTRLPLTANGKVDRKALPEPGADAYVRHEYAAPMGEVERTLASLWAQVLQLDRVGRHDNFFELGGDSLLAVTLIERMRQADLHVDVRAVLASPTLAALAASTEEMRELVL